MVTLGSNPGVGGEIVFVIGIGIGFIGRANAEENTVAGSAVRKPQLSVPVIVRWKLLKGVMYQKTNAGAVGVSILVPFWFLRV
jgi:hypothetical protein